MGRWGQDRLSQTRPIPRSPDGDNKQCKNYKCCPLPQFFVSLIVNESRSQLKWKSLILISRLTMKLIILFQRKRRFGESDTKWRMTHVLSDTWYNCTKTNVSQKIFMKITKKAIFSIPMYPETFCDLNNSLACLTHICFGNLMLVWKRSWADTIK